MKICCVKSRISFDYTVVAFWKSILTYKLQAGPTRHGHKVIFFFLPNSSSSLSLRWLFRGSSPPVGPLARGWRWGSPSGWWCPWPATALLPRPAVCTAHPRPRRGSHPTAAAPSRLTGLARSRHEARARRQRRLARPTTLAASSTHDQRLHVDVLAAALEVPPTGRARGGECADN
jgi:hypothetical protein